MASETNELTFVRCPTCRSLVPASASKCRICNAALDAVSKGATPDAAPPAGGRVRQKTVSAGSAEVRDMVVANTPAPPATDPLPATSAAKSAAPAADPETVDDTFDPLGAFLQDLDAAPEKTGPSTEPPAAKEVRAPVDLFDGEDDDDEEDDDDDLDDFDLDIFDDPSLDEPVAAQLEAPEAGGDGEAFDDDEVDSSDEPEDIESFLEESVVTQAVPAAPRQEPPRRELMQGAEARQARNRDPQPPVGAEAPAPQSTPAPRGGQGPIRPRIGGMPQRAELKSAAPVSARPSEQRAPLPPRSAEPRERAATVARPAQPTPAKPVAPAAAAERDKPAMGVPRAQARPAPERPSEPVGASAGARTNKMKPGKLFGWLVSYEHPDGRAIELRAGRFFVTATSIRPTDLILEDQSISTPHALMAIGENGMQLQDLMSERGTFVRPKGESQYTREDGVVVVHHGDWVRFGDVEFLVTLVPA